MNMLIKGDIQIVKLLPDIPDPVYATSGAAGFDLSAAADTLIPAKTVTIVPTGLKMAVPYGCEVQIRPRSGVTVRTPLLVIMGTIDSDYRGEVGVIVWNYSEDNYLVNKGDRIAQGVACPVVQATFEKVDQLTETKRGFGGFGSTGYKVV